MADATGVHQYSGSAVQSALTAGISNSAMTFSITPTTNWPDGSIGNFVATADPNTSLEEKMLCSALAGGVLTIVTRGYDGTSAVAHASGAVIMHTISAIDIAEANWIANTHARASKATPVGADEIPLFDSAASFGLKKLTWANLKTTIAAYIGTLVQTLTNKTLTTPAIQGTAIISGGTSGSVIFDAPPIGSGGIIRLPDVPISTAQNLLSDGSVDVGVVLISTTSLTSGNTVGWTGIPQTYKHLRLVLQGVNPSASDQLNLLIAAAGHSFIGQYANGSAPTTINNYASVGAAGTALRISGGSVRASNPTAEIVIDILDYTAASTVKLIRWLGNYLQAGNYEEQVSGTGAISQTAAITTFTLKWNGGTATFASGTAKLYGIK